MKLFQKKNRSISPDCPEAWRNRPDIMRISAAAEAWGLATAGDILEVGPLDKPLFTKQSHQVDYIDNFPEAVLRQRISTNPNRDQEKIVALDYVLQEGLVSECVTKKYDLIVASHVLEHVPNLFGWLRDLHKVLKPNGQIFAVIPDYRYCFDIDRPFTSFGELLENDRLNRTQPSYAKVFDQRFYHRAVKSAELWRNTKKHREETPRSFNFENSLQLAERSTESYVDCHCNLLTAGSLAEIIEQSNAADRQPFTLRHCHDIEQPFLDFIVLLEAQ